MTTYTGTYTAAIGTDSSVVAGEYCDVSVAEDYIITYRQGEDGEEIPVTGMSDRVVLGPMEIGVRVDDPDSYRKIEKAAEQVLESHGWRVAGPWELGDNAAYAPVEQI